MDSKEHVFISASRTGIKAEQPTVEELQAENDALRHQLNELEETTRAIQEGTVDAFVVGHGADQRIFTLQGADRPYRLFVEGMQQGASTLYADGTIAYCNQQLADLLRLPHSRMVGIALQDFVEADTRAAYDVLLSRGRIGSSTGEVYLKRADGGLVPVLLSFNALPEDCGAALGLLVTDLTTEKYHRELAAAHEALRESENELRKRRDQLSVLLETAAMGLHHVGPDGTILWANEAELQLLGFGRDEYIGHNIAEFHADPEVISDILARVSRGERLHDVEAEMKCRDGSIKTVLIDSNVFKEDGQFIHTQCFTRDITARKQMEEALSKKERQLHHITDNTAVMIAQCSRDLRYVFVNRACADFLKQPAEEIVGKGIEEVIGAKAFESIRPYIDRVLRGERVEYEAEVPYSEIGSHHMRVNYVPDIQNSGEVSGWIAAMTDVTDRKRAEEALRESADRFRSLISVITDVPWTADATGAFSSPQPAWAWFTGQTWDEYRGFGWIEAFHPDDRDDLRRSWTQACQSCSAYVSAHGRIWHEPTRQYRFFEAQATPVFNTDGTVREWVGAYTDIDARRQLEQQLEQRAAELARALEERKRLDEERERLLESERYARTEAERSTRLKEEFLSTVSHELRTPLNVILGWTQLMQQSSDPGTWKQGLDAIERGARGQALLIDELLDVSRIVSGKLRLETAMLEVSPLVEAAVETLRPAAEAKTIRVTQTLSVDTGPVKGDPARLQQTVWNLLSNAIKFTPKGGSVHVQVSRIDGSVEILVKDTGAGITAQFLPYVFDRFRQADNSTTRQHSGLGLGLAIVKHLVELHGGTVEVQSEGEGKGSTFVVRLPVATSTSTDETPRSPETRPRLSNVKVLVVDDDPNSCEIVRRILVGCDAQVTTAASADEALLLLEKVGPHVLVSDIGMPGKDGLTFIREIRTNELETRAPRLPAIALTAFARPEDRIRVLQAGYNTHVAKPVDPRELIAVVGSLAGANS